MKEEDTIDILVGIPSYNEADTIPYVIEQVDKGLNEYFNEYKCEIVNVDNNSPDNTKDSFLGVETNTNKKYISTPEGVKGKGNNFYNLFKYAQEKKAKAIIVVDADLKSITPKWIEKLGKPLLEGTDFVSPLYIRHKYDGTITNNIAFPLVYSLFNKNIRQPIGGDFGVSSRLVDCYLQQEWNDTMKQYGIDIFMTLSALIGDYSIKQVLLDAKIHKPSAPKLGEMFVQVVNTLFYLITENKEKIKKQGELGILKPEKDYELPEIEPPGLEIDVNKLKETSLNGFNETKEYLSKKLNEELFIKIKEGFSNENIEIDKELWSEIVFEFLKKYEKLNEMQDKMDLINAFKHLYMGRVYSFINKTQDISTTEAEKLINEQAEVFWNKKDLFLE